MREGHYLNRLESLERRFADNTRTFRAISLQSFARVAALEELFVTGSAKAGWIKSRLLLLRNVWLTVFAPRVLGRILTRREKAIALETHKMAEAQFLKETLERNQARNQATGKTPERVEDPKKP